MRKVIVYIFILFLSIGMLYSAGIDVTSPASGVTWYKGFTHDITWEVSGSGCNYPNVKINIFRNSVTPANFVEQLVGPNTGSYSWFTPNNYYNGYYVIRVKTADSSCYGDSGRFSIDSVRKKIEIVSPHPETNWVKGNTYNIRWRSCGPTCPNTKINIFKDSISVPNFVEQLIVPRSELYAWTIPVSYSDGNYIMRLKEENVYCDSNVFTVNTILPPRIKVVSPTKCDTWSRDYTYMITWEKEGVMSPSVKVNIFKDSIVPANFVEQLVGANTGSISWTIPTSYSDGNYILRVKTSDNLVYGDSRLFSIDSSIITPPKIIVTSPTACDPYHDRWLKQKTYNITWLKTGTMSANVKVLIYSDNFGEEFAPERVADQLTGPNTGIISWTVPENLTLVMYKVRVQTDDDVVIGDSKVFIVSY